jgi:thiol-disulfide isomerase/thioredoxin
MYRIDRTLPVALLVVLCITAAVGTTGAVAADPPSAEAQAAGKQILTTFIEAVRGAKTLSAEMVAEVSIKNNGMVVQSDEITHRLAVERPRKFAFVVTKGEGVAVVNNDMQFYQYSSEAGKYQLTGAVAKIADAVASKVVPHANFGQGLGLLGEALSDATVAETFEKFSSIALVGEEEVAGAKAKRVRIVRDQLPTDLWFSADGTKLVKFSPDLMTGLAAKGRTPPPGVEVVLAITSKNWSYDGVPADAFRIDPPTGAELVADIFGHPLVGKPAPKFETTSLDGKALKLEDLAGKVVVLDFWATWCGPCVAALPKISATTAKYQDKGVVFYAVNQDEEAPIIKEFLSAQGLTKVPVALDPGSRIGQAYGANAIPQTVVIDKQGKVQAVHVGAGDDIGAELSKEIDAVLAGKNLAGDDGAKSSEGK